MLTKQTDATINRPEGNRPLDAPVITLKLRQYRNRLLKEKAWKKNKKNSITLYKTNNVRILMIALCSGKEMQTESPDNILIFQVLSGKLGIAVNKKLEKLRKGDILTLHEHLNYVVRPFKKCVFLLTVVS